jgi:hypothetical protein
VTCDQDVLDWDYRYKSAATQIPHDAVLAPIPYTDGKFFPTGVRICSASRSTAVLVKPRDHGAGCYYVGLFEYIPKGSFSLGVWHYVMHGFSLSLSLSLSLPLSLTMQLHFFIHVDPN